MILIIFSPLKTRCQLRKGCAGRLTVLRFVCRLCAISHFDRHAKIVLTTSSRKPPLRRFDNSVPRHIGQLIRLLHLGMLIVGVPYSVEGMLHTEGRGGTPYGATTIAGGQGELQPKPEDLAIARALGRRVAEITAKVRG